MSGGAIQRPRPYDMRWGTPKRVRAEFGLNAVALKRAWATGKVKARQPNWAGDDRRTQTVFCFEDIHRYIECGMHEVSAEYAARWWRDGISSDMPETAGKEI